MKQRHDPNLTPRLPWRRGLLGVAGTLGIRSVLYRSYCRLLGPLQGRVSLHVSGKRARFYVHDLATLAKLQSFGGEEHLLTLLAGLLRPGEIFYDIGAEMGLYTVFLAQSVREEGQVIAFEPEDRMCERLCDNVKLNGLKNVRVFPLALSDYAGRGELLPPCGAAPRLRTTGHEDRTGNGTGAARGACSRGVDVISGDEIVKKEHLPVPGGVKIDVEGHELSVLRGLSRTLSNRACHTLCCEVHPALLPSGAGVAEVRELLTSFGFKRFDTFPRPPEQHLVAYKK